MSLSISWGVVCSMVSVALVTNQIRQSNRAYTMAEIAVSRAEQVRRERDLSEARANYIRAYYDVCHAMLKETTDGWEEALRENRRAAEVLGPRR